MFGYYKVNCYFCKELKIKIKTKIMSGEIILVGVFIIALLLAFFFAGGDTEEIEEEEDYDNRVVKTSRGDITITKKYHMDLFRTEEYLFHLGDILITDHQVIGLIWLTIMNESYDETQPINLDEYDDSSFVATDSENVIETDLEFEMPLSSNSEGSPTIESIAESVHDAVENTSETVSEDEPIESPSDEVKE